MDTLVKSCAVFDIFVCRLKMFLPQMHSDPSFLSHKTKTRLNALFMIYTQSKVFDRVFTFEKDLEI